MTEKTKSILENIKFALTILKNGVCSRCREGTFKNLDEKSNPTAEESLDNYKESLTNELINQEIKKFSEEVEKDFFNKISKEDRMNFVDVILIEIIAKALKSRGIE